MTDIEKKAQGEGWAEWKEKREKKAVLISKVLKAAIESGLEIRHIEEAVNVAIGNLKSACAMERADRYKDIEIDYYGAKIKVADERDERSPAED